MLMLASALVFRRKRYQFSDFDDLNFGVPQMAQDAIRLKSRLLYDFFERSGSRYPDDMLAADFTGVQAEPCLSASEERLLSWLKAEKNTSNKGAVHISWVRNTIEAPEASDREKMEDAAIFLLGRARGFVERCVASGLILSRKATAYCAHLDRLHTLLRTTPPPKEGAVKRPPPNKRIDIEKLP